MFIGICVLIVATLLAGPLLGIFALAAWVLIAEVRSTRRESG